LESDTLGQALAVPFTQSQKSLQITTKLFERFSKPDTMSTKLTVDDLVQAQQRNEEHLKRIAALLRDDAPMPLSKTSHYVIILTYFFLFIYTIFNLTNYSIMMERVESAPQEASASAMFAAMTICTYVLARCIELAMRGRDRA